MTFKEWCSYRFGITEFFNGGTFDNIFLPALPNVDHLSLTDPILKAGGYIVEPSGSLKVWGIVISNQSFIQLIETLSFYYTNNSLCITNFDTLLQTEFEKSGVSYYDRKDQKELANIQISFKEESCATRFRTQFSDFFLDPGDNIISGRPTLQFPPLFIRYLLTLYYQSPEATINNTGYLKNLMSQRSRLDLLRYMIRQHNLIELLNVAHNLAKSFYTNPGQISAIDAGQAAEAYSLSLKIYADLYRDSLSIQEVRALHYAANLLRDLDTNGYIKPCVERDCSVVKLMIDVLYFPEARKVLAGERLITNLPDNGNRILEVINTDILHRLFGNTLNNEESQSPYNTPRFLPDADMQSQTDELICQGGGMLNNFSLYRVLKVGMLANGHRANSAEKPHFFEYYKIEYNLGSTYVSRLFPFGILNGNLERLLIDPYTHPKEYQEAMESTLISLMSAERQLLFYKRPNTEEDFLNPQLLSSEDREWLRLNTLKQTLSGEYQDEPVEYIARDPINPAVSYPKIIVNQRNFFDGAKGSLSALEALVASIVGKSLATCHTNFMQLYSGQRHLQCIEEKLSFLGDQERALLAISPGMFANIPAPAPAPAPAPIRFRAVANHASVHHESNDSGYSHEANSQLSPVPAPKTKRLPDPIPAAAVPEATPKRPRFFSSANPCVEMIKNSGLKYGLNGAGAISNVFKDRGKNYQSVVKIICSGATSARDLLEAIKSLELSKKVISISRETTLIMHFNHFKLLCNHLKISFDELAPNLLGQDVLQGKKKLTKPQ